MTTEQTAYEIDLATAYERELEAQEQRRKAADYQKVLEAKRAKNQQAERQEKIEEAAESVTKLAGQFKAKRNERNRAINDLTAMAAAAKQIINDTAFLQRALNDAAQALAYMQLQEAEVSRPELAFQINTRTDQILIDHGAKEDPMPPARIDAVLKL